MTFIQIFSFSDFVVKTTDFSFFFGYTKCNLEIINEKGEITMNQYPYIKNIDHEKVLKIADQVHADAGQVVSKTLAQNDFVSVTLFAFSKGEEISTHDSIGDAMVNVIEGTGKFIVDGKEYIVNQGESLVMPAKKPHSVHAVEAFKMMLVVIFPLEQD